MGLQTREEQYAKETDDVMNLLVEAIADVKAGKGLAKTFEENLTNAVEAGSGADQIDDEFKEHRRVALRTVGARMGELTDVLLTPKPPEKEVPSEPAPAA